MPTRQKKDQFPKWVLAYSREGLLVDFLKHPDFVFDSPELALDRKADAFLLLRHISPGLTMDQVHVVPLREFQL